MPHLTLYSETHRGKATFHVIESNQLFCYRREIVAFIWNEELLVFEQYPLAEAWFVFKYNADAWVRLFLSDYLWTCGAVVSG